MSQRLGQYKGLALLLVKGAVSACLISWLLFKADISHVLQQARDINPWMLAGSIGLMFVQIALGAMRWGMVLRDFSGHLSRMQTLAGYYIGNFFSQILPGVIAGDAVRMWYARRAGLPLNTAINSVMLERGVTVLGLVVLVTATQPFLLARVPTLPGTLVFPALTVMGFVGIGVLCLLDLLPSSWRRWRIMRGLAQLAIDTRQVFLSGDYGLSLLLVAIIGHINLSLSACMLAQGLGLHIGMIDCMVLIPPVILIMTLPISIAGWGVREMAMVTAFGFIGVPEDSALLLSILFGVVSLVGALPGGVFFLLSADRHALAHADEACAESNA